MSDVGVGGEEPVLGILPPSLYAQDLKWHLQTGPNHLDSTSLKSWGPPGAPLRKSIFSLSPLLETSSNLKFIQQ